MVKALPQWVKKLWTELKGRWDTLPPQGLKRVVPKARYLGVAGGRNLRIYDIFEDPTNPSEISHLTVGPTDTLKLTWGVFLTEGYAYVTQDYSGIPDQFHIVDISDPYSPTLINTLGIYGALKRVWVEGNYAFICNDINGAGLRIVDVSDPASPTLISTLGSRAYDCHVVDNLVAVQGSSGFYIVDVSDPTSPEVLGSISGGGVDVYVDKKRNLAFVNTGGGLRIIDISDPTSPTILSYLDLFYGNGRGVWGKDNYVYLAGDYPDYWHGRVVAVDTSDPTNPTVFHDIISPVPRDPGDLYITANTLYCGTRLGYLVVYDITNYTLNYVTVIGVDTISAVHAVEIW